MFTPTTVQVDGEKLRKLRHERVMSIGDLSRESGLHRNVISKLENGRGGAFPESIRKIAAALEVEPSQLVK